jgi:hypothetical protein
MRSLSDSPLTTSISWVIVAVSASIADAERNSPRSLVQSTAGVSASAIHMVYDRDGNLIAETMPLPARPVGNMCGSRAG